ncbi:MAG: hypothetical protein RLZZ15_2679 [Verrucomicrobiota bacterium]|jgi:hypothetical protein
MSYWDTSALIKLYVAELDSAFFEQRSRLRPGTIVSARIALWEARATFRRKEAQGLLAPGMTRVLHQALLADLAAGKWRVIEADDAVENEFNRVLDLCYRHTPPLPIRTLDAIHLAAARVARRSRNGRHRPTPARRRRVVRPHPLARLTPTHFPQTPFPPAPLS